MGMGNNPINGLDPDGGFCTTCPNQIYAELSNHVYSKDLAVGSASGNGWVVEDFITSPLSGFQGAVYSGTYEGKKEYIFVTRGTSSL